RPQRDALDEQDAPPVKLSAAALREAIHLFGYLWPYRVHFIAALVALFISGLLSLAFPRFAGRLVDVTLPASAASTDWFGTLDGAALGLVGVLALQAAFSFVHSYWFNTVGERSLADLRRDTYGRLIRLSMAFHTKRRVGELSSRLASDLTQIQDTLVFAVPHFLRQITILVGGITLIALTSGRLTLVMLCSFPVLM